MIKEIYGKKIGSTQIFDEEGNLIAATLIEVEPVYLLERIDYPTKARARIGCFKIDENKISRLKKPVKGYFDKLGVSPYKLIKEVQIDESADFSFAKKDDKVEEEPSVNPEAANENKDTEAKQEAVEKQETTEVPAKEQESTTDESSEAPKEESPAQTEPAQEKKEKSDPRQIGLSIFNEGDIVDIRARTKGKGFAGGMKRHGWSGQPKSHGSTTHRRIGSAGASAYPSKIIKGLGMPGHMGDCFRTIKNLKVLKIDETKDLLFIKGSVPGARGAIVKIKKVS